MTILNLRNSQQISRLDLVKEFMTQFNYNLNDDDVTKRVKIAMNYYLDHGFSVKNKSGLFSQLNGIDFNLDLQVVTLEPGTVLDQMQDAAFAAGEIRQGQYYSFHHSCECTVASATERGIAECTLKSDDKFPGHEHDSFIYAIDKKVTKFHVIKPVKVLVSLAKAVDDTWSMWLAGKAIAAETTGQGTQLYVGMDGNACIKSEHDIAFDLLMDTLSEGLLNLEQLSANDREVLNKQVVILHQKAEFASAKNIMDLYSSSVKGLEDLKSVLNTVSNVETLVADHAKFKSGVSVSSILDTIEHALNIHLQAKTRKMAA